MKRPIEPADIRKGDLIRTEAEEGATIGDGLTASEWRAKGHEDHGVYSGVQLFLLDRPEPVVELPTEPTMGWAEWVTADGEEVRDLVFTSGQRHGGRGLVTDRYADSSRITAFLPATPVPTSALQVLRGAYLGASLGGASRALSEIATFLAAVDKATS